MPIFRPTLPPRFEAACAGNRASFTEAFVEFLVGDSSSRYPDGMVVCSPVAPTATAVRGPRGDLRGAEPQHRRQGRFVKAREYQATPSVQRYVMIEQERIGATVLVRAQDGWSALILKDDDTLEMPEIGLAISSPNSTKA